MTVWLLASMQSIDFWSGQKRKDEPPSKVSEAGTAIPTVSQATSAETGNQLSSELKLPSKLSDNFPAFCYIETHLAIPFELLMHHNPPPINDDLYRPEVIIINHNPNE